MRMSHSSLEMYNLCARKWKHKYIDKLRSKKIASPLFFGSALDEAFSLQLLKKKELLTETELSLQLTKTPEEVFLQKMLVVDHNKQSVELSQSPFADYFASDFSPELMNKSHESLLQTLEPAYKLTHFIDFHTSCREQLNARKKLQNDDQILYNYMSWLSLVEKGKLMINAYEREVIPQIHRVESLQESISLKNGDGDEIVGLIDLRASFVDDPLQVYTLDNKTSSKPYPADCVETSQQLSTYCEAKEDNHAGYIVVEKKLYKKTPGFIRVNVHKGVIPEETKQKVFDLFENTVYNIEAQKFPKNESSCFAFGKMCEYYKICKYDDYTDLVNMTELKEE